VLTGDELESDIDARLAVAEGLIASARMVGDERDQRLWRASRELWAADTIQALGPNVDASVLHAFHRAVASSGSVDVLEDLSVELEGVRRGMAVLIGLRPRPGAARPAP
jgi:hypothetical protein